MVVHIWDVTEYFRDFFLFRISFFFFTTSFSFKVFLFLGDFLRRFFKAFLDFVFFYKVFVREPLCSKDFSLHQDSIGTSPQWHGAPNSWTMKVFNIIIWVILSTLC